MVSYYQMAETGQVLLTDMSNQERVTDISLNQGVFWDYDGRGSQFGKGS